MVEGLDYYTDHKEENKEALIRLARNHSKLLEDLTDEQLIGLALDFLVTQKGFNAFIQDAETMVRKERERE